MNKGIYYNLNQDSHTIKLVGELRFCDSEPLANMAKVLESEPQLGKLNLDLWQTKYLDSTMLGVIGEIGFLFMEKGQEKPILFCQKGDVLKTISTMGLTQVFEIKQESCPEYPFETLEGQSKDFDMKQNVIRAHEMLVKIDPNNQSEFEELLRELKTKDTDSNE